MANLHTLDVAGRFKFQGADIPDGEILRGTGDGVPALHPLRELRAKRPAYPYQYYLVIGQSNAVGFDGGANADWAGLDKPHADILEVSRGTDKSRFYAAPAGELHVFRDPSQPDSGGIGPWLSFGKRRLQQSPEIKKIAISVRAVGATGFTDNNWNPGDTEYDDALNEALAFLLSHPEYRLAGILWHQGENDATAGMSQGAYETALAAMVTALRAALPGGAGAPFLCGTMRSPWINEGGSPVAARAAIDAAHRRVAEFIPNSATVDLSALVAGGELIHFPTADLRLMGPLYADVLEPMLDFQNEATPTYLLRYSPIERRMVNVLGSTPHIDGAVYADDATRGTVLDTNATGFNTSMTIRHDEFTKAAWININALLGGFNNIISGWREGASLGHFMALQRSGSGSNQGTNTTPNYEGQALGTWFHMALTYADGEMRVYLNGVPDGGNPHTIDANDINLPGIVQLGRFGNVGTNSADVLLDDVFLAPFAMNDAGVLALYNATNA